MRLGARPLSSLRLPPVLVESPLPVRGPKYPANRAGLGVGGYQVRAGVAWVAGVQGGEYLNGSVGRVVPRRLVVRVVRVVGVGVGHTVDWSLVAVVEVVMGVMVWVVLMVLIVLLMMVLMVLLVLLLVTMAGRLGPLSGFVLPGLAVSRRLSAGWLGEF